MMTKKTPVIRGEKPNASSRRSPAAEPAAMAANLDGPSLGRLPRTTQPPSAKPANPGRAKTGRNLPVFSVLRLVFLVALVGLIGRLAISALYPQFFGGPSRPRPAVPVAQAAPSPTAAALQTAAPVASALVSSGAISGAMVSGAAMILGANLNAAATSAIPLAPEDEDLRLPQRPSSTAPSNRPANSGAAPVTSAGQGTGAPLPPSAEASSAASRQEALSRKEFELNRREQDLDTREQALKTLEADVTVKIQAGERTREELNALIARNQAILEEQKALREQQKLEDDELKAARVEHLVAAFKGMKPEQAGSLMSSMDDAVAVSILSAMPGSNAGKILAFVDPEKAARLVKSISERRLDPKSLLEANDGSKETQ